ncbi:MAG: calcium/sodium antiporter [Clostridia bacterium]|jgi:cation:H+ antiporter|nr:calcium/sodium antiporter [Clostridia bacterium]
MYQILVNLNILIILLVLGLSLFVLSKAADFFVNNAVKLSEILGLPELIIGATIVSLGTTLPELSASVTAAIQGNGDFALGNAVGSVITNTSLILGISALFGNIPVDKKTSHKFSILIAVVILLILPTIPYKIGNESGLIPQWLGLIFILLLPVYIYYLISQEKKDKANDSAESSTNTEKSKNITILIAIVKIFTAAFVIAFSAAALVASAEILAERIHVPDLVISATLVAFGTSVPELSTCIVAAKQNHGGLAIGNIIGANILNILFVTGASVALTPGGIPVTQVFYKIHFLGLFIVMTVFSFFAYNKKINDISKKQGIILILVYILYLAGNLLNSTL